jgi:hypothetical protein
LPGRRCCGEEEGDCTGERVGKAWQGITLFAVGVLMGMVLLGRGTFTLPVIGDDARAQDETWKMEIFTSDPADDVWAGDLFAEWIQSVPDTCDVETLAESRVVAYYRCPS